jgi:DNA polymerase-3 subunit gamma/tau
MDDMPPASDEEYPSDIDSGFSHHADSVQNASPDIAPETAQPSPEEQLSATASMLALRQKMKQRKAQYTEDKKAQVSAESPSQDAADRMSNTLRSRFSNTNATPSGQNNQAQPSQQHIEQEQSDPNQSQLQSQMSEAEGSANKVEPVLSDSVNTASDNTSSPITADFQPSVNSDESGHGSAFDDDEFFDAEFEDDMPFASDSQPDSPDSPDSQSALSNQDSLQQGSLQEASSQAALSQKNANENFSTEDHPPWDTAQSNGSVDSNGTVDSNSTVAYNDTAASDSLHNTNAEQVPFQSANQPTESKQSSYDQGASFQSNVEYPSSNAEQSNGSEVITSTPSGSLSAYLEDGTKLTHASQIDEWSNLVEQMPIAGLLKQLFLHASFSRDNGTVSLEIDNSQSHLLNESAKQQLLDTLHHGLGENVTVNITLGSPNSTPFAMQQDIHAMRRAHAHSVVQTDETIQALLSIFDASVLTDSVKAR